MRTRLSLIALAALVCAGGLWLLTRTPERGTPFASVREPEAAVPEPANEGVFRAAPELPKARLPEPAPKREVTPGSIDPDAPRRLRDPVSLARTVLLSNARERMRPPITRGEHVRAFQHDLASLADELRSTADDPSEEALTTARTQLATVQTVADGLFPRPSSVPPSGALPPMPEGLPERQGLVIPPRPVPPGVLDRLQAAGAPAESAGKKIHALLDEAGRVLAAVPPDRGALVQAASDLDAALASDRAGQGPTLRYSAARLGGGVQ